MKVSQKKGKARTQAKSSQKHWRQLDIADPAKLQLPITIVGAGGIGSELARIMAKVGFSNMEIYDDDSVEEHNITQQFYRNCDIGRTKVEALSEIIEDFSDETITCHNAWFDKQACGEILIMAVDSMDTRIKIWSAIKTRSDLNWVVDGRMGGEFFSVNVVDMANPQEKSFYEKTLYPSSEAEQLPCTAKSTMYCASLVAGFMSHQVKQICVGNKPKKQIDCDLVNSMLYTL